MKVARVFICLLIGAWATSYAGELVLNGGFEDVTGLQSAVGWTFTPAAEGSDFFYGGLPHSGDYAAVFGGVDRGYYDTISQVISTVAGSSYTFSFWLIAGSDGFDDGQIAYWDGNPVLNLTNFDQNYTFYSFDEVASSANTTIAFAGFNGPSWNYVDDVSVQGAGGTIPEPATLALIAPALLGLVALRRRFSR
jgi:hypothetical protein